MSANCRLVDILLCAAPQTSSRMPLHHTNTIIHSPNTSYSPTHLNAHLHLHLCTSPTPTHFHTHKHPHTSTHTHTITQPHTPSLTHLSRVSLQLLQHGNQEGSGLAGPRACHRNRILSIEDQRNGLSLDWCGDLVPHVQNTLVDCQDETRVGMMSLCCQC